MGRSLFSLSGCLRFLINWRYLPWIENLLILPNIGIQERGIQGDFSSEHWIWKQWKGLSWLIWEDPWLLSNFHPMMFLLKRLWQEWVGKRITKHESLENIEIRFSIGVCAPFLFQDYHSDRLLIFYLKMIHAFSNIILHGGGRAVV